MTQNKESSTIGKFVPQMQWEGDANSLRATVLAQNVGPDFPSGRRCSIMLMINHTDQGWLWSTEALGLKIRRDGVDSKIGRGAVEDSLEAAQQAAIAALPDIWNQLRDLTITDLRKGEGEPQKEPSWNIMVNKIDNSTLKVS